MSVEPESERWSEEESGGLLPDFLLDPIGAAWRRRVPLVAAFSVGLASTLLAWAIWTPTYVAAAAVLITSQKIPEHFVLSSVREDTIANINAMIGEMLAAENLSKLIERKKLFPDQPKASRIELVNNMRSRIGASPYRGGNSRREDALIYELSYESEDPREAADVANALAELFVETSVARRTGQAQQTTVFLRKQLERTEADLRNQARLVSDFRREYRGGLPDELDTNLRKLDVLGARRDSLTLQITEKENRILTLTARGGDAPPTENEVLLGELRRELARQSAVHTDEHPNVIALRERIVRMEQTPEHSPRVSAAQAALVASERRDIEAFREQIAKIDADLAELNRRVDETPRLAEQLSELEQKEAVLREDYTNTLRKVEAAELGERVESARQGGQVSILDAATLPSSPETPRWIVAAAGFALSAMFALGVGALLELIDPVLVGARQIEKLSDRPILGTLPEVI